MKKLLLALLITACSSHPNTAEIMVHAQNPEAKCIDGVVGNIDVAVCTVTDKEKKISRDFITATSSRHPFQAYTLLTVDDVKAAQKAEAEKAAQPTPTATPDAGTGGGSHAPTK